MMKNNVQKTVSEVAKSSKGKIGRRLLIIGGAVAGLALGGLWLSKKAEPDYLEDFEDFEDEDFEEEEEDDTNDSTEESTEE